MKVWEEELEKHRDWFMTKKNTWQPEEMAIAYFVFNAYHTENTPNFQPRVDTGCPSCRSAVVTGCRKIAAKYFMTPKI